MKQILRIFGVRASSLYDYNDALSQNKFPFDLSMREFVCDIEPEKFNTDKFASEMKRAGFMGAQIETVWVFV